MSGSERRVASSCFSLETSHNLFLHYAGIYRYIAAPRGDFPNLTLFLNLTLIFILIPWHPARVPGPADAGAVVDDPQNGDPTATTDPNEEDENGVDLLPPETPPTDPVTP